MEELITEEWLKNVGFKWHQLERQPEKHWLLWLGMDSGSESIGLEITSGAYSRREVPGWFCWFRSDLAGRYSRFIHVRTVYTIGDVIGLIEAITGQPFNASYHVYGYVMSAERYERHLEEEKRRDRRWMKEGPAWREIENDETMGGALPQHMDAHEKAKTNQP